MSAIRNVAVWKLLERYEMRPNSAGELERPGLLPPEGLAGGESERQKEV